MKHFLGLYFHVPFCIEKCSYCGFYSRTCREPDIFSYIAALPEEIALKKSLIDDRFRIRSIYFGGGTPSLMLRYDPQFFKSAIASFSDHIRNDIEITVEINPYAVTLKELDLLHESGINRVSVGVQSTDRMILDSIGRKTGETEEILHRISALFPDWSIDILYGIPGQSSEMIVSTLDHFFSGRFSCPPGHVSAYLLEIKENTGLSSKSLVLPDDDTVINQYETINRYLASKGFIHYEVSNYSLRNAYSIHNLAYWNELNYFGIGPSAAGKFFCSRSNNLLIDGLPATQLENPELLEQTYIMMKLRTSAGIQFNKFSRRFHSDFMVKYHNSINRCSDYGFGIVEDNRYRLAESDWLVLNGILYEFLYNR